jgi:ferredoxin
MPAPGLILIRFLPDDITVAAEPGEPLLAVAERGGVYIATGCLSGACHACEVELEITDGESEAICSCITAVPEGRSPLTIKLYSDPSW